MWTNSQFPADLVTITEEILIGKLHFLRSVINSDKRFDPSISSGRSNTWAYNLKVLKSYSKTLPTKWFKVSLIKCFLIHMVTQSHMDCRNVADTAILYHYNGEVSTLG